MLIPQHHRLLVKKIEQDSVTKKNDLYIPNTLVQEEDLLEGEVVSDTPEQKFAPGERVCYSRFSVVTIAEDSVSYHIIHEDDVIAIRR